MLRNKLAILGFVLLGLGGCQVQGYTVAPLYTNKTIAAELRKVYVGTMVGKYGVHLHNQLEYKLVPMGKAKYRLNAEFSQTERKIAIANDDSSARKEIRVSVNFTLTYLDGSKHAERKFTTIGVASYNATSSPYVTEISRESAYKDALSSAADAGVLRLSVILGQKE